MVSIVSTFLILSFIFGAVSCERILGIVPTPSYSHQIVFRPIWKALAGRGHEVTVLTTDPMNENITNLREIDLHFSYDMFNEFTQIAAAEGWLSKLTAIARLFTNISHAQLQNEEVQKLIKSDTEQFDIILAEFTMFKHFGFSKKFNCPTIGMASLDSLSWGHYLVGNPTHSSVYPDFALPFGNKLTFLQRIISFLYVKISHFIGRHFMAQEMEAVTEYFGKEGPHLMDIMENMSMLFLNLNPAYFPMREISPATVLIGGGIHVTRPKKLPEDLALWLKRSFTIYFSLGTNVKAKDISPKMLQAIKETFAKLPYQVLWKFDQQVEGITGNVKIVNWAPQTDVLSHMNVLLFITQGGLQSMEEAIFSFVPLVGIPFYLDQETNVRNLVEKGIGLAINPKEITTEIFYNTILEVMHNKTYKENIKKLARLAKDQPSTGVERAVWWTEYVLRHNGAPFLKRPFSEELPLYQYLMLDVALFVFSIVASVFYIFYTIVRRALFGRKSGGVDKTKTVPEKKKSSKEQKISDKEKVSKKKKKVSEKKLD